MIDGQQIAPATLPINRLNSEGYTPINPGDVVTIQYLIAVMAGGKDKTPVRVATTSGIDLVLGGLVVIDGVELNLDDRVLVWQQEDPIENGVYLAKTGSWVRAQDFDDVDANEVIVGTFVMVREGEENKNKLFFVDSEGTSLDVVVDTDQIIFKPLGFSDSPNPIVFRAWVGDSGSGGAFYPVGSAVRINDKNYVSINDHVSSTDFATDAANWEEVGSGAGGGSGLLNPFEAEKQYLANTPIRHNGFIYYATVDFTSAASFDAANWTPLFSSKYLVPAISNETGLKAIPTLTLAVGSHILYRNDSGLLRVWKLRAGTDAETNKIKRPNDYAATTNEKVWEVAEAVIFTANFFVSELDTSDEIMFEGSINSISMVKSSSITTVTYEARLTSGTYAAQADLTALQTWINTNVSSSTIWWIRVTGNAEGSIILKYSK